jgi:hypothetical protein
MSIEAMKLALEALEHIQRSIGLGTATIHFDSATWHQSDDAITALRRALEQQSPERLEELLDTFKDVDQCGPLLGMGREQQPAGEPVAWWVNSGHEGDVYFDEAEACRYALTINGSVTPLYTAPPPRQPWVGLTDAEIEAEFGFIDELLRDCCYRTEAKLKEKNT